MTQSDELKNYKFDTDAYTIVDFAKLKLSHQQVIDDVKLLRAALRTVQNQNLCDMGYCYGCHVGMCQKVQFTPEALEAKEALAATDRPEYKEEG